jgi:hypothetical protein
MEAAERKMMQHLESVMGTIQKNMGTNPGVKPLFDLEKRSARRKK